MTNEAHLESLQLTPEAEALAAALAAWDGTPAAWERLSALAAPSANVDAVRDAGEDLARALGAIPEAEDADGARRTAEDARGQLARALADVRPLAVYQATAESPPPLPPGARSGYAPKRKTNARLFTPPRPRPLCGQRGKTNPPKCGGAWSASRTQRAARSKWQTG